MPLFGNNRDTEVERKAAGRQDAPMGSSLEEELSELRAQGDPRDLSRADTEVKRALDEATMADIRGLRLIEQGRCPECQGRTDVFLYTVICPTCGWFRRTIAESGKCIVNLDSGHSIECDHVYHAKGDQILCVLDGVVVAQVIRPYVRMIEYIWDEGELEQAQERTRQLRGGMCSWCSRSLDEAEEGGPFEEYVAFGAMQERYAFCSEKCIRAFRKQYPSRVHRNCYETDCRSCNECIKRYDTAGFRRKILA